MTDTSETVETTDQVLDQTPIAEASETPATEVAAVGAPSETPEAPRREAWWQKRIDELTRDKYAAREEATKARQELEAAQALWNARQTPEGQETPPERPPQTRAPDVQSEATRIAAEMVKQQQFNAACNATFENGSKAFGDKFVDAVGNLRAAGVINSDNATFVSAALDTEAPEKVLFELGNKPEEAMRIAALPPTKMAIEMDRLARALSKPAEPKVSNAPSPITPVGGRSTKGVDLSDDSLSMADWMAAREKQAKERRAR